ncbi:MAG: hypothetical protein JSV22_08750 [Bacteroidales bacterium]|nr:MAG: hypothetical protein JSV22_08750 [Bacteroidales bacterium]
MNRFITLTLTLIIITTLYCRAKEPIQSQYKIRQLTIEDGLSNSKVNVIYQDYLGYMWFGTNDGLNKYDGYKIKVYKNIPDDSTSLYANMVKGLFEDSKKNLFIGSSVLQVYNREKDEFTRIKLTERFESTRMILGISEDREGNIWIATNNQGLFSYNPESGKVKNYMRDPSNPNSLSNNRVKALCMDNNGFIWVGTGNGLNIYNRETDNFRRFFSDPYDKKTISQNNIEKIYQDKNNNIWIGTSDAGLNLFIREKNEFKRILIDKSYRLSYRVRGFLEDNDKFWVGTRGGLYLMDRKHLTFKWYAHTEHPFSTMGHNSIYSIYKDMQGGLWIGTYAGGINYIDTQWKKFVLYSYKKDNEYFLNDPVVFSFVEDKKGNIYVGTEYGGINYLDKSTGKFTYFVNDPDNQNSLSNNNVKDLIIDSGGNLWIGTYGGGLNYFNTRKKTFSVYNNNPADSTSIQGNQVYSVLLDSKNNLWIGVRGGIDLVTDLKAMKFSHYIHDPDDSKSFPVELVNSIMEDSKGRIWVAGIDGIYYYDPSGQDFVNPFQDFSGGISTSEVIINSIYIDRKDNFWLATQDGLAWINFAEKKIHNFTTNDGLPSNIIYGILEDDYGNLWFSTSAGLVKFINALTKPEEKEFSVYDTKYGLQSKQFKEGAYYKASNGEMYFGGIKGFNSFFSEKIVKNEFMPEILITDFQINNKSVKIGETIFRDQTLNKSITLTDKIKVSHKSRVLTFELTAIHYSSPVRNKFAYKLEGHDKNWVITDISRRYVTYSNLPPKTYVLKVKAANLDGVWNETPKVLEITVTPPFWKTLWFKISVLVFILILTLSFYYYRINRLKRQTEYLEKIVKKRTKEIEEKNKTLIKQTDQLNKTNTLLEERQIYIEEQAEKLKSQKEVLQEQKSSLKNANTELVELNKTKDKFFSIIAHDLKNPFSSVLGFSELLNREFKELREADKLKYLHAINEACKNIYNLLENLLTWARSQTGRIVLKPTTFELKPLIEKNITLLKENLLKKNISIEYDKSDYNSVFADYDMISTVIRNLLTNAIKFTPEHGKIVVKCSKNGEFVELSISDTGIGMSAKELDNLFKIDKSLSKTGTAGETGTGLGLVISREFIEKNGGSISVKSEEGKGSVFFLELPINPE